MQILSVERLQKSMLWPQNYQFFELLMREVWSNESFCRYFSFMLCYVSCVIGLRSARGDKHRTGILCLKKALLPPLDEYFPVKLHLLRIFSNISTCLFIDDVSNALYLNISWQSDALCNMSLNMNMSKDSAGVCFTLSRDITHYAIAK